MSSARQFAERTIEYHKKFDGGQAAGCQTMR